MNISWYLCGVDQRKEKYLNGHCRVNTAHGLNRCKYQRKPIANAEPSVALNLTATQKPVYANKAIDQVAGFRRVDSVSLDEWGAWSARPVLAGAACGFQGALSDHLRLHTHQR